MATSYYTTTTRYKQCKKDQMACHSIIGLGNVANPLGVVDYFFGPVVFTGIQEPRQVPSKTHPPYTQNTGHRTV